MRRRDGRIARLPPWNGGRVVVAWLIGGLLGIIVALVAGHPWVGFFIGLMAFVMIAVILAEAVPMPSHVARPPNPLRTLIIFLMLDAIVLGLDRSPFFSGWSIVAALLGAGMISACYVRGRRMHTALVGAIMIPPVLLVVRNGLIDPITGISVAVAATALGYAFTPGVRAHFGTATSLDSP